MRMRLIDGRDGSGGVPRPGCYVDHSFSFLLVIPVLLCYLLHPHTKPNSHDTMVVIVLKEVSCRDICSLSNACNWTFRDEMPYAATLPTVPSGLG